MLILSLTFRNISESKQIRLMTQSLYKSVHDLIIFMVLVIIVLFGFVMFLTVSFGYAIYDLQNFPYASMTMFKLFVGRGVGDFYR
jgi:hypothetical protein